MFCQFIILLFLKRRIVKCLLPQFTDIGSKQKINKWLIIQYSMNVSPQTFLLFILITILASICQLIEW